MTPETEITRKDFATRVKDRVGYWWRRLKAGVLTDSPYQLALEQEYIARIRYNEKISDSRCEVLINLNKLKREFLEGGCLEKYCQREQSKGSVEQVRTEIVDGLIKARIKPNDAQISYDLGEFGRKEYQQISGIWRKRIQDILPLKNAMEPAQDRVWLEKWERELNKRPFKEKIASLGKTFKKGAELVSGVAVKGGLRFGVRELAKGFLSTSGVVGLLGGLVGGGVMGTFIAGALVGGLSSAVIEYARQVNHNLDEKIEGKKEENPVFRESQKSFFRKVREFRHAEIYMPNNFRRITKATLFGAGTGLAGGFLIEFIRDHGEEIRSTFSDMGRLINLGSSANETTTSDFFPPPDANLLEEVEQPSVQEENDMDQDLVERIFSNYGDMYTLKSGESVVGITRNLAKGLSDDQELSNGDIFSLARRIALDNDIKSDFLQTDGEFDDHSLRAGEFKLNLSGAKVLMTEILKQKSG